MKNMKSNMSQLYTAMFAMLMLVLVSCGGNEKVGTQNMISGSSSKTWKADKELDAAGNKDKLTKEEKAETMQFYSDGRFALGGGGSLQTGTWSFDQSAKRLSLQFQGADVSENFTVEQLTEKEMRLVGGNGEKMELKAQ
ncbi:hypothetical protein FVR03_10690 [Pontibacter qinzhouensis]|uniref:Lipocalin-like domain-containing protein n=1 Tax=Pontibacter qinzhouensis TaxID=2603253 RepID=A0A5C8K5Z8_9BACT|nr:hypothetical protein [Pontibacter qinzhouensis]TXK46458.1 hypothetical protein FVR03_10690 [Pontibacter qinzhouensis]